MTEQNIRIVEVPLPIETIKEYFVDKTIEFKVKYAESKLKGKIFLTYLSNLDVPCDVVLDGTDEEELLSLIKDYMEIKTISKLDTIKMAVAQIMLRASGVEDEKLFENPVLSNELIDRFIVENEELVEKWLLFIDSTMLYLIYIFKELNEELKVEETFGVLDDPNFIGLNVVNLFSIEGFLELYFSPEREINIIYFKQQFEQYMFKGQSLFPYYCNENNYFIGLTMAMLDGKVPVDPIEVFGNSVVGE
jgi:hypothetical protein